MVKIRAGRHEDLDTIMEIVKVVTERMNSEGNFQWNHIYPLRDDFIKDIAQGELFVATNEENENEVYGMIAISSEQPIEYGDISTWDPNEKVLVPHRLAVSPYCQSKGIAQQLLEYAEHLARQKSYRYVRVDTNDQNKRVQHILENKLGYTFVGTIQFRTFAPEIYGGLYFRCYEKAV